MKIQFLYSSFQPKAVYTKSLNLHNFSQRNPWYRGYYHFAFMTTVDCGACNCGWLALGLFAIFWIHLISNSKKSLNVIKHWQFYLQFFITFLPIILNILYHLHLDWNRCYLHFCFLNFQNFILHINFHWIIRRCYYLSWNYSKIIFENLKIFKISTFNKIFGHLRVILHFPFLF